MTDKKDDAAGPGEWRDLECGFARETVNQSGGFGVVAFGPVGLREHVVDDVEAAGVHKGKGFIEGFVFAGHRVGEDEVEGLRLLIVKKVNAVFDDEGEAGIVTVNLFGDGLEFGPDVNAD